MGDEEGVHKLVVVDQFDLGEGGGVEIVAEFVEGKGSARVGGDKHVDGEEGAGKGFGTTGLHNDVANNELAWRVECTMDFGEQFAILAAAVLVDDRAEPGEIGMARQFVVVEVTGDAGGAVGETGVEQALLGQRNNGGQIEEGGFGVGSGTEQGHGPCARGAADVEDVSALQGFEAGHEGVGLRVGEGVHGSDKGLLVGLGTANAGLVGFGMPLKNDLGKLVPAAGAVGLVTQGAENVFRAGFDQQVLEWVREVIAIVLFVEQVEAGKSIEQDLKGTGRGVEVSGEFAGGIRVLSQG